MSITSAIVLFSVIWFVTLWCLLPVGLRTQGDEGKISEGTPSSAPANLRLGRKFLQTTIITVILWSILAGIIILSGITLDDLDPWKLFGR